MNLIQLLLFNYYLLHTLRVYSPGENTTEQQRINGRMAVINRSYNLYSDVQRADDVVVVLPAKAGEKHFSPEQKVKLINPRITTDGYKIGERGFVNYILLADDMLPAESK